AVEEQGRGGVLQLAEESRPGTGQDSPDDPRDRKPARQRQLPGCDRQTVRGLPLPRRVRRLPTDAQGAGLTQYPPAAHAASRATGTQVAGDKLGYALLVVRSRAVKTGR